MEWYIQCRLWLSLDTCTSTASWILCPPPKTDNESGINSQPEERKKLSIYNITILFSQVGYFPLAYVREDEDE